MISVEQIRLLIESNHAVAAAQLAQVDAINRLIASQQQLIGVMLAEDVPNDVIDASNVPRGTSTDKDASGMPKTWDG